MIEDPVTTETKVADTSKEDEASKSDAGAQDDLDALLAEVKETQPEPKLEKTEDPDRVAILEHQLADMQAQQIRRDTSDEVVSMIERFKDSHEGLKAVPEKVLRRWLEGEAQENPSLGTEFSKMKSNPSSWAKIETALGNKMEKDFAHTTGSTDNQQAAQAAVRGISNTDTSPNDGDIPSQKELDGMSLGELNALAAEKSVG